VKNWARKPGWRIAAKDLFTGAGGAAVADGVTFKQELPWAAASASPRTSALSVNRGDRG